MTFQATVHAIQRYTKMADNTVDTSFTSGTSTAYEANHTSKRKGIQLKNYLTNDVFYDTLNVEADRVT